MSIAPVNRAIRADPNTEQLYNAQKEMPHDRLPTSAGIAKTNNARAMPIIISFFIIIFFFRGESGEPI